MTTPETASAETAEQTPPHDANPYQPSGQKAPVPPRIGRVAIIGGLGLLAVSLLASVLMGIAAAPYAYIGPQGANLNLTTSSSDPREALLATLAILHGLLGAVAGIGIIVLSIITIASGGRRAFGVVGLVAAVMAPGLSAVLYFVVALSIASSS